jgi:hypothetical protein
MTDGHIEECDGKCPRWIAADAPTCAGYPCMCDATKAAAPEYILRRGNPQCWWTDRNTGKIKSRCPCWAGSRDGKPGSCCSFHSANPLYSIPVVQGVAQAEDETGVDVQMFESSQHSGETDDDPLDEPPITGRLIRADDTVPADWREAWPDEERKPYVRMFEPADLTCTCVLPYQDDKKTSVLHCTDCHHDFGNSMAYEIHRKRWTEPCLDPADVADCWTGEPVMVCQGGIWRLSFESSYAPDGWTPGKMTTTR